jgi:hypothetical protein
MKKIVKKLNSEIMHHESHKQVGKFAETLGVVWVGFALIVGIVIINLPAAEQQLDTVGSQEPKLRAVDSKKEVRRNNKDQVETVVHLTGKDGTSAADNLEKVQTKVVIE